MKTRLFAGFAAAVLVVPSIARAEADFVYFETSTTLVCTGCDPFVTSLSVGSDDAYDLHYKVGYMNFTDTLALYYTVDGSTPAGSFGAGSGTSATRSPSYAYTYGDIGGTVDIAASSIPKQSFGTTVKFIVSAWHGGGGAEVFANDGAKCTAAACAKVFSYVVGCSKKQDCAAPTECHDRACDGSTKTCSFPELSGEPCAGGTCDDGVCVPSGAGGGGGAGGTGSANGGGGSGGESAGAGGAGGAGEGGAPGVGGSAGPGPGPGPGSGGDASGTGGTVGPGGGDDASSSSGPAPVTNGDDPASSSGCGCELQGAPASSGFGALALGLVALVRRKRAHPATG